jgi:hypothetical protein
MHLSKTDALLLSKVLFHYEKLIHYDTENASFEDLENIILRLSNYLTEDSSITHSSDKNEHCLDCGGDHGTGDHEEDEDDEDEDDEDEDLDKQHVLPKHSKTISSDKLHELPEANVIEGENHASGTEKICSLEFESFEDGDLYLLLNGGIYHDNNVTLIRRDGKLIEFWCPEGEKFRFTFKKLHKEWKSVFEDGIVYMVE